MKPKSALFSAAVVLGVSLFCVSEPANGADAKKKSEKSENAERVTLFDFSEADPGKKWITVNDNVMGGRSKGGFTFKGDRLLFAGSTNTNGGGFPPSGLGPGP